MYVKEVLLFALSVATCLSMAGWIVNYNAVKAILIYIYEKDYDLPSEKDIKNYSIRAAKHSLGIQSENLN